jgi:hypothetical protein
MRRLVVNPGTPQAWEIHLKRGTNRLGRTRDNDFPIEDSSVSGSHCQMVGWNLLGECLRSEVQGEPIDKDRPRDHLITHTRLEQPGFGTLVRFVQGGPDESVCRSAELRFSV